MESGGYVFGDNNGNQQHTSVMHILTWATNYDSIIMI